MIKCERRSLGGFKACKLDGDGTSELLGFTFRFMKFSESTRWPLGSSVKTTTFFKDEKLVLWAFGFSRFLLKQEESHLAL